MPHRRMRGGDTPAPPPMPSESTHYRASPIHGYKNIKLRVHNKEGEARPLHTVAKPQYRVYSDGFKSKRTKHCSPGYVKRSGKCYKGKYSSKTHRMVKSHRKRSRKRSVKRSRKRSVKRSRKRSVKRSRKRSVKRSRKRSVKRSRKRSGRR